MKHQVDEETLNLLEALAFDDEEFRTLPPHRYADGSHGYYDGLYVVSNLGRVYNLKTQRFLKPSTMGMGYKQIGVTDNVGRTAAYRYHRGLGLAFLVNETGLPDDKVVVDHIDEDRSNNDLSNLQILTHGENTSKSRHFKKAQYHKNQTLHMFGDGMNLYFDNARKAADFVGCTPTNISQAANGYYKIKNLNVEYLD